MNPRRVVVWLVAGLLFAACGDDSSSDNSDAKKNNDTETDTDTEELEKGAYQVTVNGAPVGVTRTSEFVVPVNYVLLTYSDADLDIEITAEKSFSEYTLSPKSKNIDASQEGKTLSFTATEPGYLVVQIPEQERLFILIDPKEKDAPEPGDDDVVNLKDLDGVDNTGTEDMTEIIQDAIDDASGADKNIVYVPKGTYAIKSLFLKDDMTLYLAKGALLKNITTAASVLSQPKELTLIEGVSRAFIYMDGVKNAALKGQGTIDGDGTRLKRTMFNLKIQNSSDCVVDGIVSRASPFWNTLIYRSDKIAISNIKVINNRLDGKYNETDGVDYNNSTDSTLTNAFLYTGDDCMATKADDIQDDFEITGLGDPTPPGEPYMATDNIVHEKIVCFSGSSACKVGTKTFGDTMSNIKFKDVDVITTDRALVIDAVDTANVTGTVFEDIRIEEATGRLIDVNMDSFTIDWRRTPGVCTVTDTTFTNVKADNNASCRIQGVIHDWAEETDPYYGNTYYIDGVTFNNFSIEGKVITSLTDPNASFDTNEYIENIEFTPAE